MPFQYLTTALLIFVMPISLLAKGDKTIEVKALAGDNQAGGAAQYALPYLLDFIEISDHVLAAAYFDANSIYLALTSRERALSRSLKEVGLTLKFKGRKHDAFGIRLQPAEGVLGNRRPARIASGIEPLLPKYLNSQLQEFMPAGDYSAYLLPEKNRMAQLTVPEFDALFQDSSATLVLRIPFSNPVYPSGILPFEKRGKLKLEIEIGDDFFARGFMMGRGGFNPVYGQNPSNSYRSGDDDTPVFGAEKFDLELLLNEWPDLPHRNKAAQRDFNLPAYLEKLSAWSAQSSANRGGFRGRGARGSGGAAGPPPVSFHALFAGEKIVKAGIDYVSYFLDLPANEAQQVYKDYREQWQTDAHFPVLLTLRTNMQESYLDLSRWTLFVEDDDRNQYEAMKVVDVTNDGVQAPSNDRQEKRITRPIFSARVKRLVLLFPRESFSGKPIWSKKGRKLTFVLLSNEHPEQRLEAEWRVPK